MVVDDKTNMILQELVRRSNSSIRRLREVETNIQNMEDRLVSLEDINIGKVKEMNEKYSTLENTMVDMNNKISKIENAIENVVKQLDSFAKKNEIREIERTFELLNPIRNEFVTKDQLQEELEDIQESDKVKY